jgi:hypothetical protein
MIASDLTWIRIRFQYLALPTKFAVVGALSIRQHQHPVDRHAQLARPPARIQQAVRIEATV